MSVAIATLSSKYQISIPKEIREAMHFKPGQQLAFLRVGKSLRLVPVRKMEDFFGMVKGGEEFVRDRSTHREPSCFRRGAEGRIQRKPAPINASREGRES
jgi:AbrB family looped-hinge helix DNA binding protein